MEMETVMMKFPRAAEPPLRPIDYQSPSGRKRKRRPLDIVLIVIGSLILLFFLVFFVALKYPTL